ncbi:MAG: hemolysin [Bacteroidetes bacterium GWF2_33_16]|nr:MAG: hemolysin [Bacteroidetes bacterium GWE2_32_14]OFY08287.1 MAG: hemolysin [Bacteroidetes bacterium GWF2_33_16]
MHLISSKDLSKAINMDKFGGEIIAKFLMQLLKLNKLNNLYSQNKDKDGINFINSVIDNLQFNYEIREDDLKRIPEKGPFIVTSNHPFGGIDALILMKIFYEKRPDFKAMGNFLLQKIPPIKQFVFPVNPFETNKGASSSFSGIKQALAHLDEGKSLAIFPAGEVSSYQPESGNIQDREWQASILKFIKRAEVPVIPVYFQGTNSRFFHMLGQIHPILRTAKLPSELFNKKNKTIKIRIGNPIPVKEQAEFTDIARYGRYLRARTYALGTSLEAKKFYIPFFNPKIKKAEQIIDPIEPQILIEEVDHLKKNYLLFVNQNYSVFCAPSTEMPNLVHEIGRLREITFREVGEGTNRSIDIDEYDFYYNQLIVWDDEEKRIVGAYRLGKGKDIIAQYGISGFYINSLFKIKKNFGPYLNESIELGRSFIIKEYQRKPLPLFLLWKGLLFFLLKNTDYRYLIGPVSISNDFSKFSKSLIVEFIQKHFYNYDLAELIKPRKDFVATADKMVDREMLVSDIDNDVSRIDKVIQDIENNYRVPILLKKYLQLNAKIIGFNIDPKFNDALDGLLILDIFDVPQAFIKALSKELNDESILERFNFPSTTV